MLWHNNSNVFRILKVAFMSKLILKPSSKFGYIAHDSYTFSLICLLAIHQIQIYIFMLPFLPYFLQMFFFVFGSKRVIQRFPRKAPHLSNNFVVICKRILKNTISIYYIWKGEVESPKSDEIFLAQTGWEHALVVSL